MTAVGSDQSFGWVGKTGDSKIDFTLHDGEVTGKVSLKQADNTFQTKYNLSERNITIERYNLSERLRGLGQVTFRMDQLSPDQKEAVLKSIQSRRIDIINESINSGRINIQALS